jgi:hypothetical protein
LIASINFIAAGPYTFLANTTTGTTTITTTEAVTFEFLDADLATYLGFGLVAFPVAASQGNALPVEHCIVLSESPGDLRYQRRLVGPSSQALQGAIGRPTWGYFDAIQFSVWVLASEVTGQIGAWRRMARQGCWWLFDGTTTDPWHLEQLHGMARLSLREPLLVLDQLVDNKTDAIRQVEIDAIVEGISP